MWDGLDMPAYSFSADIIISTKSLRVTCAVSFSSNPLKAFPDAAEITAAASLTIKFCSGRKAVSAKPSVYPACLSAETAGNAHGSMLSSSENPVSAAASPRLKARLTITANSARVTSPSGRNVPSP